MSQTRHTPGPWDNGIDEDAHMIYAWMPNGCIAVAEAIDEDVDAETEAANARLIAAAPDLLAACKSIMEFLSNGTPVHPGALVQAEVFNAIGRAEGRS